LSYRVTALGISLLLHLVLAVGVYSWSNDKETATRTDAGKSMTLNMSMFSPEDPTLDVDSATKHILPNTPVETSEPPTSTSSLDTIEKPATQQSLVTKNTKPIEKQLEPKPKPKPKPKKADTKAQENNIAQAKQAITATTAEAATAKPASRSEPSTVLGNEKLDSNRSGVENAYKNAVREAILQQRKYPRQARRKRLQGTSIIAFHILRTGVVGDLRIVQSSGAKQLDEAALNAVRQVRGFPPFPLGIKKQRWEFTEVPVVFEID